MQHTEAPWTTRKGPNSTDMHEIIRPDGGIIAEVGYEQDARLIAAAPELLEACKDMLMGLRLHIPSHHEQDHALLDKYAAAIAKAEGK